MTDNRHITHRSAFLAFVVAGALLQGCDETKPAPSGPPVRLYAADLTGGAKTCDAPPPGLTPGKVTDTTMKVGSDGGWCGISVAQPGGKPYDASLMVARPAHGKVFVHTVGNSTRIDYTPDFGFAGSDSFTVQLLPGGAGLRAAVTSVPH